MQLGLEGKIALVTGASMGIGWAIAARLAQEGATVVITARNATGVEDAAKQIADQGGTAIGLTCDVRSSEDINRLAGDIATRFGRLNILVNNAGGIQGFTDFNGLTDDDWQATFELNVMSVVWMVRAFRALLAAQPGGRIVNITSEAGVQPDRVYPQYGAAKAAVINLSKSLSKELGKQGIMVNCVSPGIIATDGVVDGWKQTAELKGIALEQVIADFMKLRRSGVVRGKPGEADEVASLVTYLASPLSSYITGSNFRVDGGNTATP